jgi:hypothetical protein
VSALSSDLPVPDAARLRADIDALAAMTRPEHPYTRPATSDEDRRARAWVAERMRDAGRTVTVDAAANVIVRRPGRVRRVFLQPELRVRRSCGCEPPIPDARA